MMVDIGLASSLDCSMEANLSPSAFLAPILTFTQHATDGPARLYCGDA